MKSTDPTFRPENEHNLQQVIEPLANYLCATEQPHTALKMALATLFREMNQINLAAASQLANFPETRCVMPV